MSATGAIDDRDVTSDAPGPAAEGLPADAPATPEPEVVPPATSRPLSPALLEASRPVAPDAPGAVTVTDIETSAPPAPVPPVARRSGARQLVRSVPEYPAALRKAKVGGTVEVSFTVDETGRVSRAEATSGPRSLRTFAEAAVRQWVYEPAAINGVPVVSEATAQFRFDPDSVPPR